MRVRTKKQSTQHFLRTGRTMFFVACPIRLTPTKVDRAESRVKALDIVMEARLERGSRTEGGHSCAHVSVQEHGSAEEDILHQDPIPCPRGKVRRSCLARNRSFNYTISSSFRTPPSAPLKASYTSKHWSRVVVFSPFRLAQEFAPTNPWIMNAWVGSIVCT